MPPTRNKKVLSILVLIVIIIGLILLFGTRKETPAPSNDLSLPPAGTVAIRGEMVCLPHIDTEGPQTMECAFGLRDGDGVYFALRDSDPEYRNISNMPTNKLVIVEGTFTPQRSGRYQSVGVIEVTKITPLEGTN